MKCEDVQAYLTSLFDGELNSKQTAALEDHMAECADCTAVKTDFEKVHQELENTFTALKPKSQVVAEALEAAGINEPLKSLGGYEFLKEIGKGAMGTVYKARQVSLDRIVALKILASQHAADKEFVTRFLREARSAGQLNHPHIIRVHDVAKAEGQYFFVMEFVDGKSLKEIIRDEGVMEPKQALTYIQQVAQGLAHAHKQGIIHRDIKPDNILINTQSDAKIADLGLAKQNWLQQDKNITATGTILGTPYYMSPEQAEDSSLVTSQSDIYSIGATLYHMVTGKLPYDGASALKIISKVVEGEYEPAQKACSTLPASVSKFIDKLMVKDPKKRIKDCDLVAQEAGRLIEELKAGPKPLFEPPSNQIKSPRPAKKLPTVALLVAAVLLLALGAGIMSALLKDKNGPQNPDVVSKVPDKTPQDGSTPIAPDPEPEIPTPETQPEEPETNPNPQPSTEPETQPKKLPSLLEVKAQSKYASATSFLKDNPHAYREVIGQLNLIINKFQGTRVHPLAVEKRTLLRHQWKTHLNTEAENLQGLLASISDNNSLDSGREKMKVFTTQLEGAPWTESPEGQEALQNILDTLTRAEDRLFSKWAKTFKTHLDAEDQEKALAAIAGMEKLNIERKTEAIAYRKKLVSQLAARKESIDAYAAQLAAHPPILDLQAQPWQNNNVDALTKGLKEKLADPKYAVAHEALKKHVADLEGLFVIPDNAMEELESSKRKSQELRFADGTLHKGTIKGELGTYAIKEKSGETPFLLEDLHPTTLYNLSLKKTKNDHGGLAPKAWARQHALFALFVAQMPKAALAKFEEAGTPTQELALYKNRFDTSTVAAQERDFQFHVMQETEIPKLKKAYDAFIDRHDELHSNYPDQFANRIMELEVEEKVLTVFTKHKGPITPEKPVKLSYTFKKEADMEDFQSHRDFWRPTKKGLEFVYTGHEPLSIRRDGWSKHIATKAEFTGDFDVAISLEYKKVPDRFVLALGSATFALHKREGRWRYALINRHMWEIEGEDFKPYPSGNALLDKSGKLNLKMKREGDKITVSANRKIAEAEFENCRGRHAVRIFVDKTAMLKKFSINALVSSKHLDERRRRIKGELIAEKALGDKEKVVNLVEGNLDKLQSENKEDPFAEGNELILPAEGGHYWVGTKTRYGAVVMKCEFQARFDEDEHWLDSGIFLQRHEMQINPEDLGTVLGAPNNHKRKERLRRGKEWNELLYINDGNWVLVRLNGRWIFEFPVKKAWEGRLAFQSHTGSARFRNIQVAPLGPLPPQEENRDHRHKRD